MSRNTRARTSAAVALAAAVALGLGACSSSDASSAPAAGGATSGSPTTVNLVVHDSFVISDAAKAAFEKESGLTLNVVTSGDGGQLANQLVLTKDAPLGDAFFGVDNSYATRVVQAGVIEPYTSAALPTSAARFAVDDAGSLTPIDYGDVCVNVDTAWFDKKKLTPPASYEDLTKPEYQDLTVLLDPTSSSPGTAFLFGTIAHFGTDGYLDYWTRLLDNGAKIDSGWSDAYYSDYTGGSEDGTYPVVVSYNTSPAETLDEAGTSTTTAAVLSTCTDQVEYAGVLAGAKNPEGAKKIVDFLLGQEFQSEIAAGMYMYPVLESAGVPDSWTSFAPLPATTNDVPAADIAAHRDEWLSDWSDAVGQ